MISGHFDHKKLRYWCGASQSAYDDKVSRLEKENDQLWKGFMRIAYFCYGVCEGFHTGLFDDRGLIDGAIIVE